MARKVDNMRDYEWRFIGMIVAAVSWAIVILVGVSMVPGCGAKAPIDVDKVQTCFDTPDGPKCVTVENAKSNSPTDAGLTFIEEQD